LKIIELFNESRKAMKEESEKLGKRGRDGRRIMRIRKEENKRYLPPQELKFGRFIPEDLGSELFGEIGIPGNIHSQGASILICTGAVSGR
jgi:hypothetical protein